MAFLKKTSTIVVMVIALIGFINIIVYSQQQQAEIITIRPVVIDSVLLNPGIGFTTFQRFNGDDLNAGSGWTEGYPIDYQEFDGDLKIKIILKPRLHISG